MSEPIVSVQGLVKVFDGELRAVDGIDLELAPGEIFGLLGPNGAGKTTIIKVLVTLLKPDAGTVRVAGHDVVAQPDRVREAIGYVSQDVAVDRLMTGRENLELLANLYHLPPADVDRRVAEVLDLVELTGRADDPVRGYSGGMRKRLDIAGWLLHRPRLLVLDEPTLGLDVQTRAKVWDTVRTMRAAGTTVLLTTHYMDEADQLSDRIAIVDHGRIQALGTPGELKSALGGDCLQLALAPGAATDALVEALACVDGVSEVQRMAPGAPPPPAGQPRPPDLTVWVREARALQPLLAHLAASGTAVDRLSYARPTLDEVFLKHTGRHLRD